MSNEIIKFPNVLSFKERISETNKKINGFSASLMLIVTISDFYLASLGKTSITLSTYRIILLGLIQLFCFLMVNKFHYKFISFLTVIGYYFTFFIFPLLPGIKINEELTLLVLITSLPIIIIPTIVFHIVNDRIIIFSLFIVMLITAVYDIIILPNDLISHSIYSLKKVFDHYPMIKIAHIGSLIFLFLVVYYNRLSNHNLREEINQTNNLLKDNIEISLAQSNELIDQKESLDSAQEELNFLNKRLEKKVMLRTHKLKKQNKELTKYAFMNSHILKAPIARLKGLLNLTTLSNNDSDQKQFEALIEEEIENLDQASKAINAVMQRQDKDKLKEIQKRVTQIYGGL